tara:strand:- start:252 stop:974 length:723 start_codon:yes stop_codon:yes gene_type:complete
MKFSKNNTKLKKTVKIIKKLDLDLPRRYLVWGLPAFKAQGVTMCPGAGACAGPCFARSGHYLFNRRKENEWDNYITTQMPQFISMMNHELRNLKPTLIRIHDSGDFYSDTYFMQWLLVARMNPSHYFYAYTKSWEETRHWRYLHANDLQPDNFQLVYSYGGKHDDKLTAYNQDNHNPLPVSKIFKTEEEAIKAAYTPSPTDLEAIQSVSKIGLIYHNNKHSRNFKWNEDGSLFNNTQSQI